MLNKPCIFEKKNFDIKFKAYKTSAMGDKKRKINFHKKYFDLF